MADGTQSAPNSPAVQGVFGKLPARGDFVRIGLPGDFVAAWDGWLQQAVAGSRDLLGDAWQSAFLEAPVWRFTLAPGLCGAGAVLGVVLPSVDSVGRYFPLTIAAIWPPVRRAAAPSREESAWLDAAADAGCAALEHDIAPDTLLARLTAPPATVSAPGSGSRWWTDGAPRVAAGGFSLPGLPDARGFAAMLDNAEAQTGHDWLEA